MKVASAPRTIRFRILTRVNGTLAVVLAIFLGWEYQRAIEVSRGDKHASLHEEAVLMAEGVERLRHHGADAVQGYLDAVCSRMHNSISPRHHLVVELDGVTLQAQRRASPEIAAAMQSAATTKDHTTIFRDDELVVATGRQGRTTVLVAESARAIRKAVLADIGWHLMVISVTGVLAALILNLVLLRTIDAPLRRLVTTVTEIGRGRLGTQTGRFNTKELMFLASAIDEMSTSLAGAESQRRVQLEKAREIQRHLLPSERELPGLRVSHLYRPAAEVSGDYYDVFELRDDSYLICVADVVGHGIPAAMSAAMLKVLLQEATRNATEPAEILAVVNHRFMQISLPSDFASMLLVRWDPGRMSVKYASAGHGPTWLFSGDAGFRPLQSTGLLLGIDSATAWETHEFHVFAGDRLLLATDGVTETSSIEHELFGQQRVRDLLEQNATLSVHNVVQRIEQELASHRGAAPQMDDVTLVLVEFTVGMRTPAVLTDGVCHAAG